MLVSIIVVTYNSSKYVLKTLESAYRQTYADIELIVSDDCSTDNTFSICKEWAEKNQGRFVRTIITQTPSNGGICHNYNYALSLAAGDYIKYIAGDDILEDCCIQRFVEDLIPDTFLYTCFLEHLNNDTGEKEYYSTRIPDTSARKQARFMLKYLYGINGPTLFVNREKLIELGGFDEEYSFVEDWPIAIKFLVNGYRIGNVDEALVQWRIYGDSISHSNHAFAISLREAVRFYTSKYCIKYCLPFHHYHHWLNYKIVQNSTNDKKPYWGYLFRLFDIVNWKRKIFPIEKAPYSHLDNYSL